MYFILNNKLFFFIRAIQATNACVLCKQVSLMKHEFCGSSAVSGKGNSSNYWIHSSPFERFLHGKYFVRKLLFFNIVISQCLTKNCKASTRCCYRKGLGNLYSILSKFRRSFCTRVWFWGTSGWKWKRQCSIKLLQGSRNRNTNSGMLLKARLDLLEDSYKVVLKVVLFTQKYLKNDKSIWTMSQEVI